MEISVFIQGFNEERRLTRLFEPLKDFKDIVFIDHESTDNTASLAKKLGARVFTLKFPRQKATKEDIIDFTNRFGYTPQFKAREEIPIAWKARTDGQKYCKSDWVLNLDCDEVLTWNDEKVKKLLPLYDVINCKYYHERTPAGGRMDWFQTSRLYNRKKTFWIGRQHEVLNGYNLRMGWSDDFEIDHFQNLTRDRSSVIHSMEYAVLRDQDIRSFYYLGKEYHHWGHWKKAINILTLYLKEAWYTAEKVKAYIMIAESMYQLGRDDEAYVYATQALKLNPMCKEAYLFLAQISPKKEHETWLKHAELATNDHLL
jgi:glycosyltransferase involved in cell wall biosynthesis